MSVGDEMLPMIKNLKKKKKKNQSGAPWKTPVKKCFEQDFGVTKIPISICNFGNFFIFKDRKNIGFGLLAWPWENTLLDF